MSRWRPLCWLLSAPCLLLAGAAHAQTNLETNAGIQFNFSPPGAANLALGGAFLALADDATTAYTNPAGLTQLFQPEVHVEARRFRFTHVFTDRGTLNDGLVEGRATDTTEGFSFLSYVYPCKRWTIALYRHEPARFEANFATGGALLGRETRLGSSFGIPGELDGRLATLDNAMDLRIVNQGFSLARRFASLSLGLGLSYYDFSLDTKAERTVLRPDGTDLFDGPANEQTQMGDDHDIGLILGFLWQGSGRKWNVGGVYRQGPSFSFMAASRHLQAPANFFPAASNRGRFHVPDFYGVGVAYKPNDSLRVTVDYDRVEYSDLTRDFIDIFGLGDFFAATHTSGEFDCFPPGRDPDLVEPGCFVIDDAGEVHAGMEYFFVRKNPIVIRFGAWYDPDHTLRYAGTNPGFLAIFRPRGDEMHYTLGLGVSHRSVHFAAAFDYSQRVSTGSLSATVYF